MMYYSFDGFSPFHMFGFSFLPMAIFWGLLIYGIFLMVKHFSEPKGKHNAMDILKARYAKGEITREEFENIKKDIQ